MLQPGRGWHTSQVEEAGLLMILVKDCAGSILQFVCGEDCDAVSRKISGESSAAVVVFKSGDTGSHYKSIRLLSVYSRLDCHTISSLDDMRMRLMERLSKLYVCCGHQRSSSQPVEVRSATEGWYRSRRRPQWQPFAPPHR